MNTSTKSARVYGWQRPFEMPHPKTSYGLKHGVRVNLPSSVDLRPKDTPIMNQGQLGSCTGNGWAGALNYLAKNKAVPTPTPSPTPSFSSGVVGEILIWIFRYLVGLTYALVNRPRPTPTPKPRPAPSPGDGFSASRLFIYWNERNLEGTTGSDAGAAVADGAKVVSTLGAPPETDWPYDVPQFASRPPQVAYDDAKAHVAPSPTSVDTTDLAEVKTALANGHPIVFGFDVHSSFENVGADGTYRPAGRYVGGHCVMAVGYDDARQGVICRNSWGTEWGADGYFFFPYSYFTTAMVSDAWTIAA